MPRGRRARGEEVLMKSAEMLGWALGGLEREIAQARERLAVLTAQATRLRARLGVGSPGRRGPGVAPTFDEPGVPGRQTRRRRMSREARKRISEMMKKRWAERRKAKAQK